MRYLFGDSTVYTGNDNQDSDPSGCHIADEYLLLSDFLDNVKIYVKAIYDLTK